MSTPQDPVSVARGMTAALNAMEQRLAEVRRDAEERAEEVARASRERDEALRRYGRRNRKYIIIDVLVTVVATVATAVAVSGHQNQLAACEAGNQRLAREATIWAYVESLVRPPPHPTAAQKAQAALIVAGIREHVRVAYAPRNCAQVYRLP